MMKGSLARSSDAMVSPAPAGGRSAVPRSAARAVTRKALEIATCDRRAEQGDIDLPEMSALSWSLETILQRDLDIGQFAPAGRYQRRHVAVGGSRREADIDRPGFAVRHPAGQPAALSASLSRCRASVRKRCPAGVSLTARLLRSSRVTSRTCSRSGSAAKRRLRHVQPQRRAPEMQFFRNCNEAAQLAQLKHETRIFNVRRGAGHLAGCIASIG